jgi:hypothetical protein
VRGKSTASNPEGVMRICNEKAIANVSLVKEGENDVA